MLPGAGLGDNSPFSHPLSQQTLPQGIVQLVSPGVEEVLPLEEDLGSAAAGGEPFGEVERRRSPGVIPGEGIKLRPEGRVVLCLAVSPVKLVQGGNEV